MYRRSGVGGKLPRNPLKTVLILRKDSNLTGCDDKLMGPFNSSCFSPSLCFWHFLEFFDKVTTHWIEEFDHHERLFADAGINMRNISRSVTEISLLQDLFFIPYAHQTFPGVYDTNLLVRMRMGGSGMAWESLVQDHHHFFTMKTAENIHFNPRRRRKLRRRCRVDKKRDFFLSHIYTFVVCGQGSIWTGVDLSTLPYSTSQEKLIGFEIPISPLFQAIG